MDCFESFASFNQNSIFELITRLCKKISLKTQPVDDCVRINSKLVKKMRSRAFGILLNKSETVISRETSEPTVDMLSYYFIKTTDRKSLGDYYDLAQLKEIIDWIVDEDIENKIPYFTEILTCIVDLQNSIPNDFGRNMFENPFSYGKLDEVLPPVATVNKNDPKPYQHFPPEIFQIPFNTNTIDNSINNKSTLYPFLINTFMSKPGTKLDYLETSNSTFSHSSNVEKNSDLFVLYTKSIEEFTSLSRLYEPRDLHIPNDNFMKNKISPVVYDELEEKQNLNMQHIESGPSATLWELASMKINVDPNIWEEVYKLPPVVTRGFISSSLNEISYWKKKHLNRIYSLNVISESQLILHLKYLIIGIESSSFVFDTVLDKFVIKPGLCIEGLMEITLQNYLNDIVKTGTCYCKLNNLVTQNYLELVRGGFVYKAMCESIRQYLVWFRMEIDKLFGEGLICIQHENKPLPSLMEVINDLKPYALQIQTMAKVYKVYEKEYLYKSLRGASLMAYLYNEITLITSNEISSVLYYTLKETCSIYFKFIQHFIFEGELEDNFQEFFIKKDSCIDTHKKSYWNRGFTIRNNETIPDFLCGLAKYILLCGKSLRLLKLCNPDDPLCIMLSSDYPQIKCCMTFEEVENQQLLYDHYRTQCLYVCGEPVTFQSIMIQKDTEKRLYRELMAIKQADTMEKLIEERKRLSKMLQINKKKQFAALREAAENAIKRRKEEKEKCIKEDILINQHTKVVEKIHQMKLEEEKKKVLAFYDEIEKEVIRRQMMADWKIKRLRLDKRRVQLLTSEKLNLNRERLEYEHKSLIIEDLLNDISNYNKNDKSEDISPLTDLSNSSENLFDIKNYSKDENLTIIDNKLNNNEMFSENEKYTNILEKILLNDDINKNIINNNADNLSYNVSPSDIINQNLTVDSNAVINVYKIQKNEALKNKQKVMTCEFDMKVNNVDSQITELDHNYDSKVLSAVNNNLTDAQKNKIKILGSNVINENVPTYTSNELPQYNTEASREALQNKKKILGCEFYIDITQSMKTLNVKSRSNLTLDLNKCNRQLNSDWTTNESTPSSNIDTPGDFNTRLDIETPSTFNPGPFGLPSAALSSPISGQIDESGNEEIPLMSEEFRFPNIIEEYSSEEEETMPDGVLVENISVIPEKTDNDDCQIKSHVWNFIDDELNFDNFKPFDTDRYFDCDFTKMDIFDKPLKLENKKSPYTDIADIIKSAEKKPMTDTFKMITYEELNENILQKIDNLDMSTIAVCLQRSIMIPLSCQMELVNNATLKYFLVNLDLYEHLKTIRDYYFLMDGEFAKMFCKYLFNKLNTTISPKELLNFATLQNILDKSCGSSIYGVNKFTENISITINNMPLTFHHSSPDVLECLTLSYNVSWPLDIILSQDAMERYTKVFQFLIKLRRVSWVLEHDSEVLKMSLKEELMVSRELLHSPQYHSIQLYRYIMSSLIRALNSYILTTCLQISWSELEKDLTEAHTLDDLYSIHVKYIKKVIFKCLLNNRSAPIMKVLNDIFSIILRFHHHLNARYWHIAENEVYYTHPLYAQMRDLFITFERLSKHFYKIVTKYVSCGYQPYLAELLSVIDMNDYYKINLKNC